jgi:hypothetical protein
MDRMADGWIDAGIKMISREHHSERGSVCGDGGGVLAAAAAAPHALSGGWRLAVKGGRQGSGLSATHGVCWITQAGGPGAGWMAWGMMTKGGADRDARLRRSLSQEVRRSSEPVNVATQRWSRSCWRRVPTRRRDKNT